MKYNETVFRHQYAQVFYFALHLTYSRVLRKECKIYGVDHDPHWVLTIDAHVLRAAIRWCNVFGSSENNDLHWKKLSLDGSHDFESSFRNGVLSATNLDSAGWNAYWHEFTAFRNGYAAHADLEYQGKVPNLDIALNVAYFYDEWVRNDVVQPYEMVNVPLLAKEIKEFERSLTTKLSTLLSFGR